MSFTEKVKNELAHLVREDKKSRKAELLSLLRIGGSFVTGMSEAADWNFRQETTQLQDECLSH